jgi:hypothetical protein
MGIIDGYCTLSGDELEEQLRLGHSLYVVDMNSINGSPMIFLVTLVEMDPDGKSGKYGFALIWPDEYVVWSPPPLLASMVDFRLACGHKLPFPKPLLRFVLFFGLLTLYFEQGCGQGGLLGVQGRCSGAVRFRGGEDERPAGQIPGHRQESGPKDDGAGTQACKR